MLDQLTLASEIREFIPIVAIGGGLAFGLVFAIGGMIQTYATSRQREKTKREIAAYIAEGSMTPEEGERLIRAGAPSDGKKKSCGWC
ncbi:MAG: hypothetical protein RLN60_05105 [Phycisphaerales bacterium]